MLSARLWHSVVDEGLGVTSYRAWKLSRLVVLEHTRFWQRLQPRSRSYWNSARVDAWRSANRARPGLIQTANIDAFREWGQAYPQRAARIVESADAIRKGEVDVFGETRKFDLDHLPWKTDWRVPHSWPDQYFRSYRHYERGKAAAYDVKFAWELSRFGALVSLASAAALAGDQTLARLALTLVEDWESDNPVAYTVNWHPMECAIRGLNLVIVADLLAGVGEPPVDLAPILRQVALQGEFLSRTVEFTRLRGNHYAANIVGLLVMGNALMDVYPPARRWYEYGRVRLAEEISGQFCADGVNFEKATGYHRLVTELFLLALRVLDLAAEPLAAAATDRLHRACAYAAAYTRPDGLAPVWGDNDSARVFGFEPTALGDHRAMIDLAAARFCDRALVMGDAPAAAVPLFLGSEGLSAWQQLVRPADVSADRHFEEGGMIVSRDDASFLFADYGEVGLRGRGGHGHNDTFSFELALGGEAVIVDPGSPVYTGDLAEYDRYRGTAMHNVLRVDGQEIAELGGAWRISDEAHPEILAFESGDGVRVSGRHGGYRRLDDPVDHEREITFDREAGHLRVLDRLRCAAGHEVEQFLHFDGRAGVVLEGERVIVELTNGRIVQVSWSAGAAAVLTDFEQSPDYGRSRPAKKLTIAHSVEGDAEFEIVIRLQAAVTRGSE